MWGLNLNSYTLQIHDFQFYTEVNLKMVLINEAAHLPTVWMDTIKEGEAEWMHAQQISPE